MGMFLLRYKKWLVLLLIAGAATGAYTAWTLSQKGSETVLLDMNGQMENLLAANPLDSAVRSAASSAGPSAGPSPQIAPSRHAAALPIVQSPSSRAAHEGDEARQAPAATPAQSPSQIAERKEPSGTINLNTATLQMLKDLPGIGDSKAKAIIAYREQHGDFKNVDAVMKVKGIGPKLFAQIKDRITV